MDSSPMGPTWDGDRIGRYHGRQTIIPLSYVVRGFGLRGGERIITNTLGYLEFHEIY
jgi:hypothetical protein